jgi:hypothetical protein
VVCEEGREWGAIGKPEAQGNSQRHALPWTRGGRLSQSAQLDSPKVLSHNMSQSAYDWRPTLTIDTQAADHRLSSRTCRQKLVHRGVCMAAYSCKRPLGSWTSDSRRSLQHLCEST